MVQSDGSNSALRPVVYGDIALSIKTQYNKIQYKKHNTMSTVCAEVPLTCIRMRKEGLKRMPEVVKLVLLIPIDQVN